MESTLNPQAPLFNPSFPTVLPSPFFALPPPSPPPTAVIPAFCDYPSPLPSSCSYTVLELSPPALMPLIVEYYLHPPLYAPRIVENLHVYVSSLCTPNPYMQAPKSTVRTPKESLLPPPGTEIALAAVQEVNTTEPTKDCGLERTRNRARGGFGLKQRRIKVEWKPKDRKVEAGMAMVVDSLEFKEEMAHAVGKTTVMIRNIPNKFREMLVEKLRSHCLEMNSKEGEAEFVSEFDFVYLPMDFRNKCNLGYAFVNFTTTVAASRFYRSLHNQRWGCFGSKKVCEICYARVQGKEALKNHFRNSNFTCDSWEYLPVEFSPPCDGSCSSVGSTIGRLGSRPAQR